MNQTTDLDRLLDRWLADGPSEAPDRVIETVADRIERQPQRPAWRLRWREIHMNGYLKPLAAVTAAIVIGVLGFSLLGGSIRPTVGSPTPSPTASPTPAPSPRVLPTAPALLAPGTYAHLLSDPQLTFTVPSGWYLTADYVGQFGLGRSTDVVGDGMHVWYDMRIASKDAACSEAPEPGIGHDAASIIADIAARPGLTVSAPQAITVAGFPGRWVDVALAPTWTKTCPFSEGRRSMPLITDVDPAQGPFWGVDDKNRIRVIALDTGSGRNIVITVDSSDGTTFDAIVAGAMPVIESMAVRTAP